MVRMDDSSNPYYTYGVSTVRNPEPLIHGNQRCIAVDGHLHCGGGGGWGSHHLSSPYPRPLYSTTPPPSRMMLNLTNTVKSKPKLKCLFGGPEMQRRKRVAKYKLYAVEGKVKASLKKGFRWFTRKCSEIVCGY